MVVSVNTVIVVSAGRLTLGLVFLLLDVLEPQPAWIGSQLQEE